MGKKNFAKIYSKVKKDSNGKVLCKISAFSDEFDKNNNYAGVIIYGYDGKTSWKNLGGEAAKYNGKSFYIIIKNTKDIQPRLKDGLVHYYPTEKVLGIEEKDQMKLLSGGFSYQGGDLKFNSGWCNQVNQKGLEGTLEEHDNTKELSAGEIVLVKYCWEKYVKEGISKEGVDTVFEIPADIESQIIPQDSGWTCILI